MKENIKTKVGTVYNNVVLHWKTPALGKYVPYKEILSYGVGGMGVQFILYFASLIALSATSFLVGNTIGIEPMRLQYMAVASTLIGFGITIVRSYIIDNSKFKMGKFRPWLATMGIPTVIISIVFVWLPYETMSSTEKVIAVLVCYNLLQCFFPFYQQSYTDLANVISPNSQERTDIVSVSSIIYSFAPTLTGAFVPFLSKFTGGLNNIQTYRIIHPIVAIIGLALCYVAVFGTKERIIVAKTHISHFKFSDAFRSVAKNKYFWITSLGGWLGFLEGAVGVIIGWTFIYGYPDKMGIYGIATTLIGNAALWAMILCPFAIRTIGKRNLLIWCNVANIFLIALLYPLYHSLLALIIIYYLNGFVGAFAIVYTPGINADMRDYQQYYTGERIDGMFGAVGIIGSFVGMFTGLVLPYIYQSLGLADNYDVLEVASFRDDMFHALIIAAVIGAFMNVVPYLFYDLTEVKQRGIVKVLKIRALFEDYGNGVLKDEDLVEAVDLIDEANELYKERAFMTTKDDIVKAKHLPKRTPEEREFRKAEIARTTQNCKKFDAEQKAEIRENLKAAKAVTGKAERKAATKAAKIENKAHKKINDDISVCEFLVSEMHKFETDRIKEQVKRAKTIIAEGADGIYNYDGSLMKQAKSLPTTTHAEKEIRSDALQNARAMKGCQKNIKKYFPEGKQTIFCPSDKDFDDAEELPESTFAERVAKKRKAKELVNAKSRYNRSLRVLLDAERLLKAEKNYQNLDEIREKYEESKERSEASFLLKKEEIEKLEAQRKEDIEKRKAERLAKKGGKK